jgi:hypothetical protein
VLDELQELLKEEAGVRGPALRLGVELGAEERLVGVDET